MFTVTIYGICSQLPYTMSIWNCSVVSQSEVLFSAEFIYLRIFQFKLEAVSQISTDNNGNSNCCYSYKDFQCSIFCNL